MFLWQYRGIKTEVLPLGALTKASTGIIYLLLRSFSWNCCRILYFEESQEGNCNITLLKKKSLHYISQWIFDTNTYFWFLVSKCIRNCTRFCPNYLETTLTFWSLSQSFLKMICFKTLSGYLWFKNAQDLFLQLNTCYLNITIYSDDGYFCLLDIELDTVSALRLLLSLRIW